MKVKELDYYVSYGQQYEINEDCIGLVCYKEYKSYVAGKTAIEFKENINYEKQVLYIPKDILLDLFKDLLKEMNK